MREFSGERGSRSVKGCRNQSKNKKNFTLLQINCQCLRNKVLELEHLCLTEGVEVVCLSEHWLRDNQVELFVPKNFQIADIACRKQKKNGGGWYFGKKRNFI